MKRRESSASWWQSAPGMITAIAGLVTAIGGLLTILLQAGIIGPETKPESQPRTDVRPAATEPAPQPSASRVWANAVAELESRLENANIQLSTGSADDQARVRDYMSGPNEPYSRLAQGCLEALAGRRLTRRAHLDMIDKWYTLDVGADRYLTEGGTVRVPEVKVAMVKATNEIHGTRVRSFEELLVAR
jgi:hypothetical protein